MKKLLFLSHVLIFLTVLLIYIYASLIKLLNAIIDFLLLWICTANFGEENNPSFLIDAVKYSKLEDELNFLCKRKILFMNNALGFV